MLFSNCQLKNLTRFTPLKWNPSLNQWKYVYDISQLVPITPDYNPADDDKSSFDITDSSTSSSQSSKFSITTFNVLFDRNIRDAYNLPTSHASERFEHALDCLRDLRSDVVCFQEVTSNFARLLMEQDWIRQDYFISYDDQCACLEPFGQLTISRFPMLRVWSYKFGALARKRVLLCDMLVNDRHLVVANVHLPADKFSAGSHTESIENKQRQGQLRRIISLVQETANDHFVVGDFNFGDNDHSENEYLDESHLNDAWKLQHELDKEPGFTFDPAANELTHILCPSAKMPQRVDRILFSSDFWKLEKIDLALTEPFKLETDEVPTMHSSDHYGVHATFALR